MRLADAIGLRIGGKDAIEARLNGRVVWTPSVSDPLQTLLNEIYDDNQTGFVTLFDRERFTQQKLFRTAATLTPVTDAGDPIGLVVGLVNNVNATQSVSAKRPVYSNDSNRSFAVFNGSETSLSIPVEDLGDARLFADSGVQFSLAISFKLNTTNSNTIISRASANNDVRIFQVFTYNSELYINLRGNSKKLKAVDTNTDIVLFVDWDGSVANITVDEQIEDLAYPGTQIDDERAITLGGRANDSAAPALDGVINGVVLRSGPTNPESKLKMLELLSTY